MTPTILRLNWDGDWDCAPGRHLARKFDTPFKPHLCETWCLQICVNTHRSSAETTTRFEMCPTFVPDVVYRENKSTGTLYLLAGMLGTVGIGLHMLCGTTAHPAMLL